MIDFSEIIRLTVPRTMRAFLRDYGVPEATIQTLSVDQLLELASKLGSSLSEDDCHD